MKVIDIQKTLKEKKTKELAISNVDKELEYYSSQLDKLAEENEYITPSILQDFLLKEIGEEDSTIIYNLADVGQGPFLATSKVSELVNIFSDILSPDSFLINHKKIMMDGNEYFINITFSVDENQYITYLQVRMIAMEGNSSKN